MTGRLQDQARAFSEPWGSDRMMNLIKSTVLVLYRLSTTTTNFGDTIGLVRHKTPMPGCSALLILFYRHSHQRQRHRPASVSYSLYVPFLLLHGHRCDIRTRRLGRVEHFLTRLDVHTNAMDEIIVKVIMELVSVLGLALATKELKHGPRVSPFLPVW